MTFQELISVYESATKAEIIQLNNLINSKLAPTQVEKDEVALETLNRYKEQAGNLLKMIFKDSLTREDTHHYESQVTRFTAILGYPCPETFTTAEKTTIQTATGMTMVATPSLTNAKKYISNWIDGNVDKISCEVADIAKFKVKMVNQVKKMPGGETANNYILAYVIMRHKLRNSKKFVQQQ